MLRVEWRPGFRVLSREVSQGFDGRVIVEASQAGSIVVGDEGVEVGIAFGMVEEGGRRGSAACG